MKATMRVWAMVVVGMILVSGFAGSAPGPELMNYQSFPTVYLEVQIESTGTTMP